MVTPSPLSLFKPTIKTIKYQKSDENWHIWYLLSRSFQRGQNLVLKDYWSLIQDVFYKDKVNSSPKYVSLQQLELLINTQKANKNLADNHFHNILRLFHVLTTTFSRFHHSWNDGRLLLINMVCKSCLTKYGTTWDFRF